MTEKKSIEIQCPACGKDALLVRAPKYEGFTRVGEELSCSACGQVFAEESEIPFKQARRVTLFTEADRSKVPELFEEGESAALCRHCAHYVINPFTQWCAIHRKEVEATDTCGRFEAKPPDEPAKPKPIL